MAYAHGKLPESDDADLLVTRKQVQRHALAVTISRDTLRFRPGLGPEARR